MFNCAMGNIKSVVRHIRFDATLKQRPFHTGTSLLAVNGQFLLLYAMVVAVYPTYWLSQIATYNLMSML